MQKLNISLSFDDLKLKALETYLQMENSSVQKKLEEAMTQLYEQMVPKEVQGLLDCWTSTKPKRSVPTTPKPQSNTKKEIKSSEQP